MRYVSTLSNREQFRQQRESVWRRNVEYWLRGPLRHVIDVGDYIADRTAALCRQSGQRRPIVVDMGFGDAWLLRALIQRQLSVTYVGLDCTEAFVRHARKQYSHIPSVRFELVDLEEPLNWSFMADVVVNAFNFFELCELAQPFANAKTFLRPGGTLQIATIDKTYLMLALCNSFDEFRKQLSMYQDNSGTKYFFQPIDLGHSVSETLFYPSVLYSTEDYLSAAKEHMLVLKTYKEHAFTDALVPKIYCHYEFEKVAD